MQLLTTMVNQRLLSAYKPKTWTMYKSMFLTFMAFCEFMTCDCVDPSFITILAFIEFLHVNHLKYSSILNYTSAIKSQSNWLNIPSNSFDHPKIKTMLKAILNYSAQGPKFKGVFDLVTLLDIINTCWRFPDPNIYISIYLLAFFGFFRISNLLPPTKSSFDIKKHLCRGDIIYHNDFAIVLVKWSKTIQTANKATYIMIPNLGNSPLCPVRAVKSMCQILPLSSMAPLFCSENGVFTQSQVRSHLKKVLSVLNIDATTHSFHTFRRSGATLAFNSNVAIQHIKRQGTWSSEAVNHYIVSDPTNASVVANTFKHLLST